MKKYFPFFLSLCFLAIAVLSWDYIRLPYNYENAIIGEYYYKNFNPLNEVVRFFLSLYSHV